MPAVAGVSRELHRCLANQRPRCNFPGEWKWPASESEPPLLAPARLTISLREYELAWSAGRHRLRQVGCLSQWLAVAQRALSLSNLLLASRLDANWTRRPGSKGLNSLARRLSPRFVVLANPLGFHSGLAKRMGTSETRRASPAANRASNNSHTTTTTTIRWLLLAGATHSLFRRPETPAATAPASRSSL